MPVSAIIPIVEDYREVLLPAGYADQIRHSLIVGGYIYYFCGFPLGQMLKINKNDFTDRTVLTFPNDNKHRVPLEMCHAGGVLYCLFRNVDTNDVPSFKFTIGRVQTDPFAILSDFVDVSATYIVQNGSITTDGTSLYVIVGTATLYATRKILKYAISGGAPTVADVTGFGSCHCIRYSGGKIYLTGADFPGATFAYEAHAARMTTGLVIEQTATWEVTDGEFSENEFGISADHIWVSDRSLRGIVKKFQKSDLAIVTDLPTSQLARSTQMTNDGRDLWVLFENGRGVRFNPSSNAQAIYALNDGQGFQSELVGDGTYLWTGWNQDATKIARYHIPSDVAAGDFVWSQFIFGTPLGSIFGGRAAVLAVKADSDENVIAAGTFSSGEVDFGGTTKTTSGTDIFIAKYNPDKTLMWVKTFTSVVNPQFIYLALDSSDNIFITGAFTGGSLNLGGGVLPYTGLGSFSNIFLGWFSPGSQGVPGTHLFSRSIGSNRGNTRPNGIWVDGAGMVVLAGGAALNTDFGGGTTSGGGFIAKYSSVNVYQWDKVFLANVVALTVDGADQIIILGTGSVNLGGGTISNPNSAWVAKFTAGSLGVPGTHTWSRPVATIGAAFANGVATDGANRAVVVGSFGGTVNFGGGNVSTDQGATAAYVAVFDSSSNYANHLKIGGRSVGGVNGSETAFGVDVDTLNNIAFFGRATGEVSWGDGGTPDVGTGNANAFIAKYDSLLAHQWHIRYSSAANITGNGITADPSRNTIFGGSFIGAFDFGDGNQSSPVTPDGMLLKFGA